MSATTHTDPSSNVGEPTGVPPALRSDRLVAKAFLADDAQVDPAALIPVFHRYVREGTLPGLLIDVADYKHVHRGPGVLLVGHQANYAFDLGTPGPGVMVQLKRDVPSDPRGRFTDLLRRLAQTTEALAAEPDLGFRFDPTRVLVRVHDRLLAPHRRETFRETAPVACAWAESFYGVAPVTAHGADDPRRPFGLFLHLPA